MRRHVKLNRPVWCVVSVFLMTTLVARLVSHVAPRMHWEPIPGMHIHHYVYGIFILAIAGYLALIVQRPGARLPIALFYGLGLALTFDEFGMWINPRIERGVRWNYNGLAMVVVAIAVAGLIPILLRWKPSILRRRASDAVPADSGRGTLLGDGLDIGNSRTDQS
jgi:hypothetical protein